MYGFEDYEEMPYASQPGPARMAQHDARERRVRAGGSTPAMRQYADGMNALHKPGRA